MKKVFKTIIVDDDSASIERLQRDLAAFPEIKVIDTTTSVETGKSLIINKQPDLLFLDVEMPEISGIDLLKEIKSEINPSMRIVFYTAYDKYMLDAFRASAFDYITKPYLPEELELVIKRVMISSDENQNSVENLLRKFTQKNNNRFAIQAITGVIMVKYDDVLLFEFPKNERNWVVRFTNDKLLTLRATITSKEILSVTPSFMQVSQNCIINITHLSSIENKTLRCKFYPPHEDIIQIVKPKYYKKIKEILDIL